MRGSVARPRNGRRERLLLVQRGSNKRSPDERSFRNPEAKLSVAHSGELIEAQQPDNELAGRVRGGREAVARELRSGLPRP